MNESILTSVKKALGVGDDYLAFDADITLFTNSALSVLSQVGVGPPEGFMVQDKTTLWADFLDADPRLNMVQTYTYLFVRLLFDPPGNSFAVQAIEKQKEELIWRINAVREEDQWTDPINPSTP